MHWVLCFPFQAALKEEKTALSDLCLSLNMLLHTVPTARMPLPCTVYNAEQWYMPSPCTVLYMQSNSEQWLVKLHYVTYVNGACCRYNSLSIIKSCRMSLALHLLCLCLKRRRTLCRGGDWSKHNSAWRNHSDLLAYCSYMLCILHSLLSAAATSGEQKVTWMYPACHKIIVQYNTV